MMNYLFSDPLDQSFLSLGGVYDGKAGILNFSRDTGRSLAYLRFDWMTSLDGHVNAFDANGYTMFFCGTLTDPRGRDKAES